MTPDLPVLGIFGAGKAGTALARLAVAAGYRTLVTGSPRSTALDLVLGLVAPGAEAADAATTAREADVLLLVVPFGRRAELPVEAFDGKVVVDAMNYWPPVDGHDAAVDADGRGTSEVVAELNDRARWVKSFSHLGYHDMEDDARPAGASDRRAVAVVGDDPEAAAAVAEVVDRLGFDPVVASPLARGRLLQPGRRLFGLRQSAAEMAGALAGSGDDVPVAAGV